MMEDPTEKNTKNDPLSSIPTSVGPPRPGNNTSAAQNNRILLRKEMEQSLAFTNTYGYRFLELGAETKQGAERIVCEFVDIVTTSPMEFVKNQRVRIEGVLKAIADFFFKSGKRSRVTNLTKIEYLEEELVRLQQEMLKLKELEDNDSKIGDEDNYPEDDESSFFSTATSEYSCAAPQRFHSSFQDRKNFEIPIDIQECAIPMPPPLPSEPLYVTQKQADDAVMTKGVYSRRLPPTKSLSSAIRMGAAVKLRKVNGPRSPGGTPDCSKSNGANSGLTLRRKLSAAGSTVDILSQALDAKFKNVQHNHETNDDEFDDDDSPPCSPNKSGHHNLMSAIHQVRLRKVSQSTTTTALPTKTSSTINSTTTNSSSSRSSSERSDPLLEALSRRRAYLEQTSEPPTVVPSVMANSRAQSSSLPSVKVRTVQSLAELEELDDAILSTSGTLNEEYEDDDDSFYEAEEDNVAIDPLAQALRRTNAANFTMQA